MGVPSVVSVDSAKPRRKIFTQNKSPLAKVKNEPATTPETPKKALLDQAHIVIVPGSSKNPASGVGICFLSHPEKQSSSGAFSAQHMCKMVSHAVPFDDDLVFEKRAFDLVPDGRPVTHYSRDGRLFSDKIFILQGLNEAGETSEEDAIEVLKMVLDRVREEHCPEGRDTDLVEAARNHPVIGGKVWADVMTVNHAFQSLKFKFHPSCSPHTLGFLQEGEQSWATENMEIVETCFRKGTLKKHMCAALGLGEEWAAPDEAD